MKRLFMFMCVFSLFFNGFSQEKVRVHDGNVDYVTNIDYLSFDVLETDDVFNYSSYSLVLKSLDLFTFYKDSLSGVADSLGLLVGFLNTSVNSLLLDISSLESELDSVKSKKVDLELEISSLKSLLAFGQSSINAASPDTVFLHDTILEIDTVYLQENVKVLEKKLLELRSDSIAFATLVDSLNSILAVKDDSLSNLLFHIGNLTSKVELLKSDTMNIKANYNSIINNLNDTVYKYKSNLERTNIINQQLSDANSNLTTVNNAQSSTINSQKQQLKVKSDSIAYLEEIAGVQYVDLGLPSGTLWAKYNLGACLPFEEGYRFVWGSYRHDLERYDGTGFRVPGQAENQMYPRQELTANTKLDSYKDPAKLFLGANWQTPSVEQFAELVKNTVYEIEENYDGGSGVIGIVFYKPKDSSHKGKNLDSLKLLDPSIKYISGTDARDVNLFLPFVGFGYTDGSIRGCYKEYDGDSFGCYMCNEAVSTTSIKVYTFREKPLYSSSFLIYSGNNSANFGYSVRPCLVPKK